MFLAQTTQQSTQVWFSFPKSPAELTAWSLGLIAAGALVYKITSSAADGVIDWLFDRRKKLRDAEMQFRLDQIERDAKVRDAQLAKATLEQADPATPPAALQPDTKAKLEQMQQPQPPN